MINLPRHLALVVLLWNFNVFAELPPSKVPEGSNEFQISCTGLCLADPPQGKACYEPAKLVADPCKDIPKDTTCMAAATIAQAACGSLGALDCLTSLVASYARTVCVSYPALGSGGIVDGATSPSTQADPEPPPLLSPKIG